MIDEGRNMVAVDDDSGTKDSASHISAKAGGGGGGGTSPLKTINKKLRNEKLGYLESRSVRYYYLIYCTDY